MTTTVHESRDWSWAADGALDGRYVQTRSVHISNGPSAGRSKIVLDFRVGDETVTVWPTAVLTRHLREELERRGKDDFEPGERIQIFPRGKHADKKYWMFADTEFEFAAPKPTARNLFDLFAEDDDEHRSDDEMVDDDGTPIRS